MEQHRVTALHDTVVNDGESYQARIAAVRMKEEDRAISFFNLAKNKARELRVKFDDLYTAEEILSAALEVMAYMHDHVEELDRTAAEVKILNGRKVLFRDRRYVIVQVPAPVTKTNYHRVVNLESGNESALYSMAECEQIIALALKGELKGSFDL